jgi:hypothetical protein
VEAAVLEQAFVERSIGPFVLAFSLLAPLNVVALKFNLACAPGLLAEAVLKIIYPLAFIGRALGVNKYSHAVRHVVLPLTLVNIPVSLGHLSSALHFFYFKLALVKRAVRPLHFAKAVFDRLSVKEAPLS